MRATSTFFLSIPTQTLGASGYFNAWGWANNCNVTLVVSGGSAVTIALTDDQGVVSTFMLPSGSSVLIKRAWVMSISLQGAGAIVTGVLSWPDEIDYTPPSIPAGSGEFVAGPPTGLELGYQNSGPYGGTTYLANTVTILPTTLPYAIILFFSVQIVANAPTGVAVGTALDPADAYTNATSAFTANAFSTSVPSNGVSYYFSITLPANTYLFLYGEVQLSAQWQYSLRGYQT